MNSIKVGALVTWNADGKRLFGDTNPQGIVIAVRDDVEADVRWESDQTTTATLNVLDVIPDA